MSPGGATACDVRMAMMLIVEQMRVLKMFDCRCLSGAFVTGYGDPRAYLPSPLRGGEKFVAAFTASSLLICLLNQG